METPRRYDERPLLVIWELGRTWPQGSGGPRRAPPEVTTPEGLRLLQRLTGFGEPLPRLLLTGGDSSSSRDCTTLTAAAAELGFEVAVTARSGAQATVEWLRALKEAGLASLVVSLESPAQDTLDRTAKLLEAARTLDLPVQITSRVTREILGGLAFIASVVAELGAALWRVAFPIDGAQRGCAITAFECEAALNDLHDLSLTAPFRIETAGAPHYRRVILERRRGVRRDGRPTWPVASRWRASLDPRCHPAVGDGRGLLFIDRRGLVYPGRDLRIAAGSIRRVSPVTIYRTHPLFRALRDPDRLQGRCGRCPFREVCGGSRARAFAVTGDPLAEEPLCLYTPCWDPLEAPTVS